MHTAVLLHIHTNLTRRALPSAPRRTRLIFLGAGRSPPLVTLSLSLSPASPAHRLLGKAPPPQRERGAGRGIALASTHVCPPPSRSLLVYAPIRDCRRRRRWRPAGRPLAVLPSMLFLPCFTGVHCFPLLHWFPFSNKKTHTQGRMRQCALCALCVFCVCVCCVVCCRECCGRSCSRAHIHAHTHTRARNKAKLASSPLSSCPHLSQPFFSPAAWLVGGKGAIHQCVCRLLTIYMPRLTQREKRCSECPHTRGATFFSAFFSSNARTPAACFLLLHPHTHACGYAAISFMTRRRRRYDPPLFNRRCV